MSEVFTYENTGGFTDIIAHVLIEAMTAVAPRPEDFDKKFAPIKELTVCLTVNGTEVSLKKVLNDWEENLNKWISDRAKDLLEEKVGQINNSLKDLKSRAEDIINGLHY